MLMSIVKKTNNNKKLFNTTVYLTVVAFVFYLFIFSLPHELHSLKDSDSVVLTKLLKVVEKSHHNDVSNDTNHKENSKQRHNQDNCPICNLSYFNSLNLNKPLIFDFALEVTKEKPVYKIQTGFSSFSYFKFFLRSPPSFAA